MKEKVPIQPVAVKRKVAAEMLGGVCTRTIARHIQRGRLDSVRFGGLDLVTVESIQRVLRSE